MHCHLPGALYIFIYITVRMLEIFWSDKSEKSRFFSIIFYFSVFLQPIVLRHNYMCLTASFQRFVILLFSVLVQTKQLTRHTDKVATR